MTEPLERRQESPIAKSVTTFSVLIMLTVASLLIMSAALFRLNTLVDDNRRNSEYLIECTTPGKNPPPNTGHECFDAGQARTAGAVKAIVDTNKNGVPDVKDLADALGVDIKGTP